MKLWLTFLWPILITCFMPLIDILINKSRSQKNISHWIISLLDNRPRQAWRWFYDFNLSCISNLLKSITVPEKYYTLSNEKRRLWEMQRAREMQWDMFPPRPPADQSAGRDSIQNNTYRTPATLRRQKNVTARWVSITSTWTQRQSV